ncbi:hypothetical protein QJS04_geneDACA018257 [Acorus gramineus]|uniref:tetraacyldisaccharide 4'-kinase n=1 Tax=Acorus gramineus TaxID=55184 RepID=A0AAV9BRB5_ACOGR|nr:hypothetical protein QJS04_geneDACA018257 [Acorus gramineus]
MKRVIAEIAKTVDADLHKLPLLHRLLLPVLSFSSSLYALSLSLRRRLYHLGLFHHRRLPVPVISVGNLTWGGNGKTPMVEFIAREFVENGISPLILTRGYAGGDEARMLQRHLCQASAKIGLGANRGEVAARFFERYGHMDPRGLGTGSNTEKIGVVILDDGMQHWRLLRDLEVIMVNGMLPWGNGHLLPRGPMREPKSALRRADIAIIHHADMISDRQLKAIELSLLQVKSDLPTFCSRLAPSHFFEVRNRSLKLPLSAVSGMAILCVCAIGFASAFVRSIEQDIRMIRQRLEELEHNFGAKPMVVVTEKDYDRDPGVLLELDRFEVFVLCSTLQIMPFADRTEEDLKNRLKDVCR